MAEDIREKADVLFRDLIEPMDMYYKHYNSTCNVAILECRKIWNVLHQERTQMLFAKEEYYNQMHNLQQCNGRLRNTVSPQMAYRLNKEMTQQQVSTDMAEQ